MNRRRFLQVFGIGAAAAAVAHTIPSSVFPEPVAAPPLPPPVVSSSAGGMRGLPYFINDTGDYFGLSRSTWREQGESGFFVAAPPTESEIMEFPNGWTPLIPEDYRRGKVV